MTFKLLLALAMSAVVLGGCEDTKPEVEYLSLHQLCLSGDATVSQVREFLDLGADVNKKKGEYGRTPLMWASRNNTNVEVIRLLLNSDSDVSMKDDEYGATPLHFAAQSNENPEVISALLKAGADVNAVTESGLTPLFAALSQNTDPQVIRVLIENGADTAMRQIGPLALSVLNPMAVAAAYGNTSAISALVEDGFNVNDKEGVLGFTPLMQLASSDLANKEAVSILIELGADVDARDNSGETALMLASLFSSAVVVDALINARSDVNARDLDGNTALILAAEGYKPEVIASLFQSGADINARNGRGQTPLIRAALLSTPEVLMEILNCGADPNLKCKSGKIALDYAKENSSINETEAYWKLNDASFD